MTPEQTIADGELDALFAPLERYDHLLLAVSGGADSMALLRLVAAWAETRGPARSRITVATVDHGLRAGSAEEAAWVGRQAAALGLPHAVLRWEGEKPATGVQDAARRARYDLLGRLARDLGPRAAIVTGHHRDDQVETFLMRLARGGGLDGLAGMGASTTPFADGPPIERPLIAIAKARLVATLQARGHPWLEDPSNVDGSFERARLRAALPRLSELNLAEDKIALSARRLRRARDALEAATRELMRSAVDLNGGAYASIDAAAFDGAPMELRIRLLARLLAAYGGQEEPARLARVERLAEALAEELSRPRTLSGCIIIRKVRSIEVVRESRRAGLPVLPLPPGETALWDRRFLVSANATVADTVEVRALGAVGLAVLGGSRARDRRLPHRAAIALPAFWRGGELLAAPHPKLLWSEAAVQPPPNLFRAVFILDAACANIRAGLRPEA